MQLDSLYHSHGLLMAELREVFENAEEVYALLQRETNNSTLKITLEEQDQNLNTA
jgi:hypothetical protein